MDTFDYFYQICQIPRESGNEEGMRQFLLSWARDNGFEAVRDKAGNIIVRVPATEGMENRKSIALQGHMDMVCVKREGSTHDFTKDPIEVVVDGDFIRAKDTSLGADNGVAVAMTMALFTDPDVKHGPLEGVFTFEEETGLTGAFKIDPSVVRSRKLLNLDSEEEGVIYIGCAGGKDVKGTLKVSREKAGGVLIRVSTGGLKGGHSGGEINRQRLNAIFASSRLIMSLEKEGIEYRLVSFDGGTRRNVIPSTCCFEVLVSEKDAEKACKVLEAERAVIAEENRYEEPDYRVTISSCAGSFEALNVSDSRKIAGALFTSPNGVYSMSLAVENVVETSDNLAIARLDGEKFFVEFSVRSLVDTASSMLVRRIGTLLEAFGFESVLEDSYPAWTPNPDSDFLKICVKAWEACTGKKPLVTSIHAGLECGVINSRIEGMDSISLGPDLFSVHTVNEHLSISSTKRLYDFVKYMVEIAD